MTATLAAAEVALGGSLSFALGAALQQYEAASGTSSASLLGRLAILMRRPRWLLGGVAILAGGLLHFLALGLGPLTVVQPMTVASLLFAVPIAAMLHHRRPARSELAAAAAVTAGLIALVLLVPPTTAAPHLTSGDALRFLPITALLALLCHLAGKRVSPRARAALLAIASGLMYASAATLNRVIAEGALHDVSRLLNWFTLVMPFVAASALVLLQSAYSTGHFGVAYATVQVADPVTAVTVGVLLLHERLPVDPGGLAGALAAAALVVAGTAALGRRSPDTGHAEASPAAPAVTTAA
ncbi:DMT family transporter [Microbispora sp. RL4-1S]|uniref:DMT family transporter n=1 Tax=Microbispora oryzae TaxID=2806554 RepID=A0A941AG93_9ACTN|nr:DMT family transporter [Microbispora oryzae]MBP2702761.1 DMT family transporter [Microbispora oryzae]